MVIMQDHASEAFRAVLQSVIPTEKTSSANPVIPVSSQPMVLTPQLTTSAVLNQTVGFPPYVRGKNYTWVLNDTDLSNSISYLGSHTRLRVAINKMTSGERI
jgi:hypothetical protein